jgi:hypothetical protein
MSRAQRFATSETTSETTSSADASHSQFQSRLAARSLTTVAPIKSIKSTKNKAAPAASAFLGW